MSEQSPHPSSPWRAVLILLAAMALVAGVIFGGRALVSRNDGSAPSPSASPSPTATSASATPTGPVQQTLLVQVRNDDGLALANELLTSRRSPDEGAVVQVPPRLLVDVPGGPQQLLASTAEGVTPTTSQTALADLLGIGIDGTWTLDRLAFAGLVDSIGGIYLDVRTPQVFRGPDQSVVKSLPVGIQLIDGVTAAVYVLTRQPGEPESARQDRFAEVMRQVLLRLPTDQGTVELLLGSLGALSRTTIPVDQLSELLLRLRADVDRGRVTVTLLPVQPVTVGVASADRLEFVAAETLMAQQFAQDRLVPGPDVPVRVLVFSGTGRPAIAATSREPLESAGFVFLSGGSTARQRYLTSNVIIPAGVPEAREWALQVVEALALPESSIRESTAPPTTANVVVVLGANYRPEVLPVPDPTLPPEPTSAP